MKNTKTEVSRNAPHDGKSAARLNADRLIEDYADELYKFCLSLSFTKEDADDLLQDTFLQVISHPETADRFPEPKTYLFSSAAFLWKSKKRKFAVRKRIAPQDYIGGGAAEPHTDSAAQSVAEKGELCALVKSLTAALPDKFRLPVTLFYTNEFSVAEIADLLGVPAGTVKSRLHTGRQTIKKGVIENYGEDI
jgi:RNA polymerase sigma-70 factor (ECF subfamily)